LFEHVTIGYTETHHKHENFKRPILREIEVRGEIMRRIMSGNALLSTSSKTQKINIRIVFMEYIPLFLQKEISRIMQPTSIFLL
jgi:hypothetical protein